MKDTSAAPSSPYLDAQNVWLERYGSYIRQAYNWRLLAILQAVALIAAIFGLIYVATQSKFIPYVVAVDRIGLPVGVKIADHSSRPDDRIVRAQIANFIETARSVTTDAEVQKQNLDHVYALVAPQSAARSYLDSWYANGHSPFDVAQAKTVNVHIAWVLPISSQSWQAQWSETIRDNRGQVSATEQWVGTISVAFRDPTDEATILQNPIGLYVTSISWTRKL
ncbi:MAG TPA: VirB8/TrbF family protein [Candidatus Baltobacteraceae bacterium]|jgi:type IV secretion system protein VirB5|nr:VirB8/TrbF family protein [Candidatus Baltobacteraceae bacterium]